MLVFVIITSLLYASFILWISLGWFRKGKQKSFGIDPGEIKMSVVVPVRNEADNIIGLLDCLRRQTHPSFEVLVVNDHSTDATERVVSDFLSRYSLQNFQLLDAAREGNPPGKKSAITMGIQRSQGSYVVTTDGDCTMGNRWLACLAEAMASNNPLMIIGPVVIGGKGCFFDPLQTLEHLSLTAITAGAAHMGHPLMCSGANLAFSRDVFFEVEGYQGNGNIASGDDVFLMQKFMQVDKDRILFLKDVGNLVETLPANGFSEFLQQRIRWASKTTSYKETVAKTTAGLVLAYNLMLVLLLPWLFHPQWTVWVAGAWIWKAIVDFPILASAACFVQRRSLLILYPMAWISYPFYVTAVALGGLFIRPKWK